MSSASTVPWSIRVRAAALIAAHDRILLVRHRAVAGYEYWVPPGGGMEPGDGSLLDCARREVFEETGMTASLSRIAYVREFREVGRNVHHVEVFFLADSWNGEPTLAHLPPAPPGSDEVIESLWVPRAELEALNVFPRLLRDRFWTNDLPGGFPDSVYLGLNE